jgi:glycosyltransferase involved in cell wall biosynthesis
MDPLRILHIQKVKGIGGSERHLLELLPGLSSSGVTVEMSILGTEQFPRFVSALQERGIRTEVYPAGRDLNPGLVRAIRSTIRRLRPDLVHTHLIHADIHGGLVSRFTRTPRVSSFHSTHDFYRRAPVALAARTLGGGAIRTIAISAHVGRFIERGRLARPGTVRIVPYGLDPSGWDRPAREVEGLRSRLGAKATDLVVGIAARLIPYKGHDVLIEAMKVASHGAPRLVLAVAGDGPLRPALEARARELPEGAVRFIGFQHDIRPFMNACDVLVFPTTPPLSEGFGLSALEAMVCGKPVIASRVGSLPEVVDDGVTGLIVPPADPDRLGATLVRLAGDPSLRGRLGKAGRDRASRDYTRERMVDATLRVYDEALGASRVKGQSW